MGRPMGEAPEMNELDYNLLTGPQRKVLRLALMGALQDRERLNRFLQDEGFAPLHHHVKPGSFESEVFDVIEDFRAKGHLMRLVPLARERFADNPGMLELDERLRLLGAVEGQRVARGFEERGRGLELMVRGGGFADLNLWTERLAAMGRRVCRITYAVGAGELCGSGFVVGADRVLTNYHVMERVLQGQVGAQAVRVQFGYAKTEAGVAEGESFRLHKDWRLADSPYSQADLKVDGGTPGADELDYALVRLAKPVEGRGFVALSESGAPVEKGTGLFILQHPLGEPLKLSMGQALDGVNPMRMRYDADTEHGSSGSLVLDEKLRPVALHHAGDPDSKIKARYNQGIPLGLVRASIEAKGAGEA